MSGPMENKQIEAMAAWTLEDFQDDPLWAVERVRELAAAHLALQRERDAAVQDLKEYGTARGFTCEVCTHKRGTKYTQCFYPNGVDVDDKMCRECGRCKCGHCDGVSQWEWRGPQPRQVLAPADQSAGEYADNPVLAQA